MLLYHETLVNINVFALGKERGVAEMNAQGTQLLNPHW